MNGTTKPPSTSRPNAIRLSGPTLAVVAILAIDTLALLGYAGYANWQESYRISLNELPDTTWQDWWRVWAAMTGVAWVSAILIFFVLADARRKK